MNVAFLYNNIFRGSDYGKKHPVTINRISNVFDLAKLIKFKKVVYYKSNMASVNDLCMFHEKEYVELLKKTEQSQSITALNSKKYNLGTVSNPIFKEMFRRHAAATGSLLMAADLIKDNKYNLIFSPGSGAHHAQKQKASGFCYLNDIATCIIYLKKVGMKKILYFDMDAHYGDGVVEHFKNYDDVFTISLHQKDLWPKNGAYVYNNRVINLPLEHGCDDKSIKYIFKKKIEKKINDFNPQITLLQMGADCLEDDHMSKLNFTNNAMSYVIKKFKKTSKNIILMGGGGYNPWTTLRAWIYNLAVLTGEENMLKLNDDAKNFLANINWKVKPKKHWINEICDFPNIFKSF